jgi:hypothetical protein
LALGRFVGACTVKVKSGVAAGLSPEGDTAFRLLATRPPFSPTDGARRELSNAVRLVS